MLFRSVLLSAKWSLNSIGSKILALNKFENHLLASGRLFSVKTSSWQSKNENDKDKCDILIYRGALTTKIKFAKLFSLTSSVVGLSLQPILYNKVMESGTGLGFAVAGGVFLGFFTFVTPVLLHLISRKYVTHLFYNPHTEEFTATTFNIVLFPVLTTFKASDVTKPELPTMFVNFYAKNKPFFADPEGFTDLELYKKLMGYDKPIDLKLAKPSNVR